MTHGAWKCYRCVLRAQGPLHIGSQRLGLIERTRYYLTGRNLWGMIASGLAGRLYGGDGVPEMYRAAEGACKDGLRTTYFFPCADAASEPWRPGLSTLSPAELESRLVFSQASTAIEPGRLAAEEGALHEVEYVAPEWIEGENRRALHWAGYLFVKDERIEEVLAEMLAECWMGAERRYGWGRLAGRLKAWDGPVFGEFAWRANEGLMESTAERYALPAHLRCEAGQAGLQGEMEAVAGRGWSVAAKGRGGAGQDVWPARLCWAPGTTGGKGAPRRFAIDEHGFWEARN